MPNKHIDLFKEIIPALDGGMKELWDAAGDEGQKEIKGDLWNLNRYMSVLDDNTRFPPYQKYTREEKELAVFKTNEYYNKNWAILGNKHPKLQWLILCQSGGTGKNEFHPWIGLKRTSSKEVEFLKKIYPNMKEDEAETLARISTKKELTQLAKEHDIAIKF